MTRFETLRTAFTRHVDYRRTKRAIEALPTELAIEDLGLDPFNAKSIARRAVYG